MRKSILSAVFALGITFSVCAQDCYWQQAIEYEMEVEVFPETHKMTGIQKVKYTNNSPDTLTKMYYHLYFNAFQPGSMMDARSRSISDPDGRVGSRIVKLKEDEIGYHRIDKLQADGKKVNYLVDGTLLTIDLNEPLLPGKSVDLEMNFNSQIPVQIRRSGRNNVEGVDYTMTQWYPKVAEYDRGGWMTDEYVGREFHGVWGNFDVKITMPQNFVIGGTGYIQNPEEVGHGYPLNGKTPKVTAGKLTWHFKAPMVHDFAWAADPDYLHDVLVTKSGLELHFFYLNDSTIIDNWKKLQPYTERNFELVDSLFGKYPYKQYSVIQGGDGGMEYPMATMITGKGSFGGLVSVMVHESIHSWYYGLLATNEAKYPWMDEGFTQSAQYFVMDRLFNRNRLNPAQSAYKTYYLVATNPKAEPLTTHADFYHKNRYYGINSYYKGTVFLKQLEYIVGEDIYFDMMKKYYYTWRYKHPTPDDFKRIAEKESGLNLDWYFQQFIGTTKFTDYGIRKVETNGKGSRIVLEKIGEMPLPVEVEVVLKSGEKMFYYIPLRSMRGSKNLQEGWTKLDAWPWSYPLYEVELDVKIDDIQSVKLDPSRRVADVHYPNGVWKAGETEVIYRSK